MNEIETFVRADRTLKAVVDQIRNEQLTMPLPADFPTRDDRVYTLGEILGYQAYDEAWIPTMMAGISIAGAEAFGDPFDNDLLADDPSGRFGELVEKSIDAVEGLDDAELDQRTVHYSYGDTPHVRRFGTRSCSERHALTISPRRSASTATCLTTSCGLCGRSSSRTPRSGDRSGCSGPRSMSRTTHHSRTESLA